jgi:hypothetical protein
MPRVAGRFVDAGVSGVTGGVVDAAAAVAGVGLLVPLPPE